MPANDDYMGDARPTNAPPAPEEDSHEGEEDYGETTTIPKSLCPDMQPGDEVVLRIVRGMDDKWEVAYAPEKGGEEKGEGERPPPGEEGEGNPGGGEMRSMLY
jgi:hypothetical protein